MKKVSKLILICMACVSLIAGIMSLNTSAADIAKFGLSDFNALPGEDFSTTLYLEENSNIVDFQFQLKYNTKLVTLKSVSEDEDLVGSIEITEKKNGVIHISYTKTNSNLTKKTNFVNFVFTANENIGVGEYTFIEKDASYASEAHTLVGNDLVEVAMSFDFDKLVMHAFGDVSLDGKVSIGDVTMLRQHLAYLRTLSDYQLTFADAYCDGKISISDAVRIQQHLADETIILGDRINVTFHDKDGEVYVVKSVPFNGTLQDLPEVPFVEGYSNGRWSMKADEYKEVDLSDLTESVSVYAIYTEDASAAISYYKERLTDIYYTETTLNGSQNLVNQMAYQGTYNAIIYWSSSNGATLNASTGEFNRPAYDSKVKLTATIVSYYNGAIEAQDTIAFDYSVNGLFKTPTKAEIETYLRSVIGEEIDNDMKLPKKVSNTEVKSVDPYEVRVSWTISNSDNTETGIDQIKRTTSTQSADLVATVTFNGEPLEDDGKIYFDNVVLAPISQEEIKNHIINEIAANMGLTLTSNESLWNNDTVYGSNVRWISNNKDIASVKNNVVEISDYAINGVTLPLTAEVTYSVDGGSETFELSYTVSVSNDNALLVAGTNIDPSLYDALKDALDLSGSLTTDALKSTDFVYLDLSGYPDITDLTGLSYCTNLRVLNVSGLNIKKGMHEIATLNKLEAFIASDCGLDNLTDGGVPVLKNMINLKLLDLSHNNFTSLDSVFSSDVRYGKLSEIYLNDNKLEDLSGLKYAPILGVLVLSENGLTSEDIEPLANYNLLTYLSLADNQIDSISSLKNLVNLRELRLQNNNISNIADLRFMRSLTALYLGGNNLENVYTGSGSETNISYLKYLESLKVLYLNDNAIEDIDDIADLEKLAALNVSNNKIQSLSVLSNFKPNSSEDYAGLEELYAENNEIASFSFVNGLVNLKKLMLSGNASTYEASLPDYLDDLTKLETLTLSGKTLRTLRFLSGMNKLIRLEVANCSIPSYTINSSSTVVNDATGEKYLQVSSFDDNVRSLFNLKSTLKFLDISDNGFAYYEDDMIDYLEKSTGTSYGVSGITFSSGTPSSFSILKELTGLITLYADDISEGIDASNFLTLMTSLNYISLENCQIEDTSWMSKFRNLIYVNLANNNIKSFDFEVISNRSKSTLEYLYLDTNVDCTFEDAYMTYGDNALKELSLKNINVKHIDYLPPMENIEYLNLSETPITDLRGSNEEFYEIFSIERFDTLKTLNVSHLDADLTVLTEMDNLETVYAIGNNDEYVFYKCNIDALYALNKKGVNVYLYDYVNEYKPVAKTEGDIILGKIKDFGCDITVAADNIISDNNPVLPTQINDFNITWSVSNNVNYEIVNNKLSVKSYANIDDETLTITASIIVYPDQAPVTREFKIKTKILRANENYITVDSTGMEDYLVRGANFTYDVKVKAAPTTGFSTNVKPVCDNVKYSYSAVNSSGGTMQYIYAITVNGNNKFSVNKDAQLSSKFTIKAEVGHTTKNGFVVDKSYSRTSTVATRTFTVTYVTNGGKVTNKNGDSITKEVYAEDAILFGNITVSRTGYIFKGWFTDAALTQAFTSTKMPTNDITLYAKWEANSFNLLFNANGGSVSPTSKLVICDEPFGTLPTPTRQYYIFKGWYTAASGGTQVTASTVMARTSDLTVYAQWTEDTYTLTFDANGGSVSPASRKEFCGKALSSLPTPTRANYTFNGWYTAKSGGTKVTTSSAFSVNTTIYAQWTPNKFTLTYNANGGTVSPASKTLTFGDSYGTLPTPKRDYYNFLGWFTAASGGSQVSASTKPTSATNVTIYAHWELKPVKGPIQASSMPSGAQVVSSEWRYTLREYTSNSASSLSGWTKYDTQRTSWGAWSGWSTSNPSNGVRNVETRSVYDHTEYHYYRWTNGKGYVYTYQYSSSYWLEEQWFTYILPTSSSGSSIGYVGSDGGDRRWVRADYAGNRDVDKTFTRSVNRTEYRYQEPVYTYYYYRDVSKTATSDPTGQSHVSNVVKWVTYREK